MRASTHTVTDQDETTSTEEMFEPIERKTLEAQGGEDGTESEGIDSEDSADALVGNEAEPAKEPRKIQWSRVLAYGVLPGLALLLVMAAGFLKWQGASTSSAEIASGESVAAAKDSAVALLSYKPDTVAKDLEAARDRVTGSFKDSYSQLIHDVVIPGAQQRKISSVATVPAAASVSASPTHAVVLLFVNQTVEIGTDPPTDTGSSVRVTLDKVGDRWLISGFEPI